jgi:hypothetical protein
MILAGTKWCSEGVPEVFTRWPGYGRGEPKLSLRCPKYAQGIPQVVKRWLHRCACGMFVGAKVP